MIGSDDVRGAVLDRPDFAVFDFGAALPVGSLKSLRAKFSRRQQQRALERIVAEIEDGSLYLGDWQRGEIEIVGIHRVIQNRFWTEVEYDVLFPPKSGAVPVQGTYRVIRWNSGVMSGVGAFCLTTGGEVVLLRSFRHAARRWCIDLPRGAILPDESIVDCARREAREECGVSTTERTEAIDMGEFDPDNGVLMSKPHIVCLTNVTVDPAKVNRDVSESVLGPLVVSIARLKEMIVDGRVQDSFAQGALIQAACRGLVTI